MNNNITFEFDHSYAGDLASLGLEYTSVDDATVSVTVNKWECDDTLFAILDTNCDGWY